MRLSRIKVAGFKSFVDPTVVKLPTNLVGIVGPNGCGKSNTIDAVRWVMGESSARYLRGESMDDVIFSGSSSRKPVGQASVELVFDNSLGAIGGQYAQYAEIAVKRQITREGQSQYFLNGSRCRRRDITDIFLGTGLGPRSYAIIEQGMVSRLIEAKPEELRVYLEEAAGISKYKERRRETENRIRHTQDNLDRLNDLREELDKQLAHLKRQCTIAERYKAYKEEARQLNGELLLLRLEALQQDLETQEAHLRRHELDLQASVSGQRESERELAQDRLEHAEANEFCQKIQEAFYRLGTEVSTLEQRIAHNTSLRQRYEKELMDSERAQAQAQALREQDQHEIEQLREQLLTLVPEQEAATEAQLLAQAQLQEMETQHLDIQDQWERHQRQHAEQLQVAQVEKARLEQFQHMQRQQEQRLQRLHSEREQFDTDAAEQSLEALREEHLVVADREDEQQQALQQLQEQQQSLRDTAASTEEMLNGIRNALQVDRGRLSALEALQQAAMSDGGDALQTWLEARGWGNNERLLQVVAVEVGWERALEGVLGDGLAALCLSQAELEAVNNSVLSTADKNLLLMTPSQATHESLESDALIHKITRGKAWMGPWVSVRVRENLEEAMRDRHLLGVDESFVTRDGIWLGAHWIKLRAGDVSGSGAIAREQDMATLQARLEENEQSEAAASQTLQESRDALASLEQTLKNQQDAYNQAHRERSQINARLQGAQQRLAQVQQRRQQIDAECEELTEQLQTLREDQLIADSARLEALQQMEALTTAGGGVSQRREALKAQLEQARQSERSSAEQARSMAVQSEGLRSRELGLQQNLARAEQQLNHFSEQRETLQEALETLSQPGSDEAGKLEQLLQQRAVEESKLARARDALASIEQRTREREQQRQSHERSAEQVRDTLEQARIDAQSVRVRVQTVQEQLAEGQYDVESLKAQMPGEAEIAQWGERLQALEVKIQRLGPINLAAIDEYQEQQQRQAYLQQQHDDVLQALETLREAIAKIDKETRSRFKETYERVNNTVQALFPRLFGGGYAHLELTEQDLLNTGVTVVARPPGKRVSSIQLLSGGEKALTAVALVFAFFELNPAPFCMLDEVDAPLDDANVGRFCAMVKEMSERVQFIFITHNKMTMELSTHLMGVTMHEPGVSRLVSVDLQEAAELAQA